MHGSRRDWGQRNEEEHVPLVDLAAFLPRICISRRPRGTSFHLGEQRCHAGQLVSGKVKCFYLSAQIIKIKKTSRDVPATSLRAARRSSTFSRDLFLLRRQKSRPLETSLKKKTCGLISCLVSSKWGVSSKIRGANYRLTTSHPSDTLSYGRLYAKSDAHHRLNNSALRTTFCDQPVSMLTDQPSSKWTSDTSELLPLF